MSQAAQIDLTKVKPYGDTLNDGMIQFHSHCLYLVQMKPKKPHVSFS